ncbi:hypothetical protein EDD16DRAFT_1470602 [Pisolithus croceorrhizus]|nr:hypothetical protein EDD16DRAFT_1470602 [Pisolithus croceorrhizus]KAI6163036.1 hypothetical protein EDD17DRAFT_1477205 [Pisolithus thermaeus]
MTFHSRSAYYLRVSSTVVLPLYLYLDDQHLDWMSDKVLQHVVSDLQPLIVPKLQTEKDAHLGLGAASGRSTVEVHRGDFYQFAYFFRKIEPHSVVIKRVCMLTQSRRFVAVPAQSCPAPHISEETRTNQKRMRDAGQQSRKRQKIRVESESLNSPADISEDDDSNLHHGDNIKAPRRSQRLNSTTPGRYCEEGDEVLDNVDDTDSSGPLGSVHITERNECNPTEKVSMEVVGETTAVGSDEGVDMSVEDISRRGTLGATEIDLTMEEDEEEEKPKPVLRLSYQALNVSGHCLCVVVEPWPSQHPSVPLQPVAPVSVASPSEVGIGSRIDEDIPLQRGRTPLFLPEFDEVTDLNRTHPPVPLFGTSSCQVDDNGYGSDTLMNFSQVLNATGHTTAAFAEDDDDMEGAVLFGDADEVREFTWS